MKMRPDQERVKNLLTDTVTLLCKNGLQFNKELKVQGLLGITTDDNDVFVVHINEKFGDLIGSTSVTVSSDNDDKGFVDLTEKRSSRPQAVRSRKRPSDSQDSNYSSGSPAKISSPPGRSVQPHRGAHLGTPTKQEMRIKTEEGVESSSCQEQQQFHSSSDDRNAMQESYSELSICDIQGGNFSGGTAIKRRSHASASASTPGQLSGESGSDTNQDVFTAGFVRNQMQSGSLDSDLSGLGSVTAEPIPGGSSWDPSQLQGSQLDPGDPEQVNWQGQDGTPLFLARPRRPVQSTQKSELCDYPGCGKAFYYRQTLLRHQTLKHGRKAKKKASGDEFLAQIARFPSLPQSPGTLGSQPASGQEHQTSSDEIELENNTSS